MTGSNNQRNVKKDVYANNDSDSWDSGERKHKRHHSNSRSCKKKCDTICQRLDLSPPKNACEKKTVKHFFQVSLGKCEVTRDVKVTHCITANLKHHIEENVVCHHEPCTKYTHKKIHSVENGNCCKVKFPECDDKITYLDKQKSCEPCPGPCLKSCPKPKPKPCPKPKPKPCDSDSSSSDGSCSKISNDSVIPHKKHHHGNNFW